MRWIFTILLGVILATNAVALVVYVDGPGDGDGSGTDDHDTIRDALIELGADGGGEIVNEVHIMVDRLTAQPGLLFNGTVDIIDGHSPLPEPVIVEGDADGNGVRCVVDFNSPAPTIDGREAYIHNLLDGGQSVTLRDLTVMPTYRGFDIAHDFIDVWSGEDPLPLTGAELTFERFTITASNASNEPQDPDIPASDLTRITDGFNDYVVMRMFPEAQNAEATLNLRDCVFAHQQAATVFFNVDSGTLNVSNTRITRCGFFVSGVTFGSGIRCWSRGGSQIDLDRVIIDHNWGQGLYITNPIYGGSTEANIGPGCQFNYNSKNGVWIDDVPGHGGTFRAQISGTEEEPVVMVGNGSMGCFLDPNEDSSFSINHAVIADNHFRGITIYADPVSGESNLIANTLIANNAESPIRHETIFPPINCRIVADSTATGLVSVEFRDCTFHDVQSQLISNVLGATVTDPTELVMESFNPFGCEVVLTNCIFSGSSDEDAFHLSDGVGNVVTLNDSCVALEGEHAIGELRPDEGGTLNLNDTLFIDPQYVNVTTPLDDNSFDVRQPLFVSAGPASAPLTGWGDFVADMYEHAGLIVH